MVSKINQRSEHKTFCCAINFIMNNNHSSKQLPSQMLPSQYSAEQFNPASQLIIYNQ